MTFNLEFDLNWNFPFLLGVDFALFLLDLLILATDPGFELDFRLDLSSSLSILLSFSK